MGNRVHQRATLKNEALKANPVSGIPNQAGFKIHRTLSVSRMPPPT